MSIECLLYANSGVDCYKSLIYVNPSKVLEER